MYVQVMYLPTGDGTLLEHHWTLEALQSVASAGHRLACGRQWTSTIEAALIRASAELSYDELWRWLSWAFDVGYMQLRVKLAQRLAGKGSGVNLGHYFPDERQGLVVQAMQARMDELAEQVSEHSKRSSRAHVWSE